MNPTAYVPHKIERTDTSLERSLLEGFTWGAITAIGIHTVTATAALGVSVMSGSPSLIREINRFGNSASTWSAVGVGIGMMLHSTIKHGEASNQISPHYAEPEGTVQVVDVYRGQK